MNEKESSGEQLTRFGRNINALGGIALGGAALLIPGPNAILGTLAAVNAAQAGGFELLRKRSRKKRQNKNTD